MKNHLLLAISILVMTACGNNTQPQNETPQKTTSQQDQLLHYWDDFPYSDSTVWTDTVLMRNALVNWIQTLSQQPDSVAHRYATTAITAGHGKPEGQKALFLWLETFLNNPNSPFRNEELFIPVLEAMTADTLLCELDKARPSVLLTQALKNRKGTEAADIAFITKDGRQKRLYDIHCEQILIYFFNPDCHDCKRVGNLLKNDMQLNDLQRQGRLQVVALYPDEDLTSWNNMDDNYPTNWIIGRVATEQERDRYNLPNLKDAYNIPAIPSIYILDSAYIVLVKDALPY